jgi:hypothetical protein
MGLSRGQFTKEFKLAAGGESFARGRAMRFRAWGSGAGTGAALLNWSARSASRRWRLNF